VYASRLSFHTTPAKTSDVETKMKTLLQTVQSTGDSRARILCNNFASGGAPDIAFEQEADDLATLEAQIRAVTDSNEFQQWTNRVSGLLHPHQSGRYT
jgi:hypothetical protein